ACFPGAGHGDLMRNAVSTGQAGSMHAFAEHWGQFSTVLAAPAFFLSKTVIERAYAAIAPNLECCQAIVFMI
ncbi:MAG: hypothetical protein WBF49_10200, partial [Methyloceanibacter sp.]